MTRYATKTPGEREDDAAAELIRPEPKKKPPRQDLRNERMEVDDPDTGSSDPDMSLNYKRVALLYRLRQAEPKHKPGEAWKTDDGWRAINMNGTPKSFSQDEAASAKEFATSNTEQGERTDLDGDPKDETPEPSPTESGAPSTDEKPAPPPDVSAAVTDFVRSITGLGGSSETRAAIEKAINDGTQDFEHNRENYQKIVCDTISKYSERAADLFHRSEYETLIRDNPEVKSEDFGASKVSAVRGELHAVHKKLAEIYDKVNGIDPESDDYKTLDASRVALESKLEAAAPESSEHAKLTEDIAKITRKLDGPELGSDEHTELQKEFDALAEAIAPIESKLATAIANQVQSTVIAGVMTDPTHNAPTRHDPAAVADVRKLYKTLPDHLRKQRQKNTEREIERIQRDLEHEPEDTSPYRGDAHWDKFQEQLSAQEQSEAQIEYYKQDLRASKFQDIVRSKPSKSEGLSGNLIREIYGKSKLDSPHLYEMTDGDNAETFRSGVHNAMSDLKDEDFVQVLGKRIPDHMKPLVSVLKGGTYEDPVSGDVVPLTPEVRHALRTSILNSVLNANDSFGGLPDGVGPDEPESKKPNPKKPKSKAPADDGAFDDMAYHPGEVSLDDILGEFDVDDNYRLACGDFVIAAGFDRTDQFPFNHPLRRNSHMTTKPIAKKASVEGARRLVATLDNIASVVQHHYAALGIPQKVAMDYATRTDMISDALTQGIKTANYFDAGDIGKEVKGPLEMDPKDTPIKGHFTQERFDALQNKVVKGEIEANAAAHRADPKLAALRAAVAALTAVLVAAEDSTPVAEEKAPEAAPPAEEKKSEGDAAPSEESDKDASASFFNLYG